MMLNRLILKVTKFQLPPPKRLGTVVKNILEGGIMPPPPMSNRVNKLGKHREKTFHTNPPFLSVYTGCGGEGEEDKSFTSVCTTKNIFNFMVLLSKDVVSDIIIHLALNLKISITHSVSRRCINYAKHFSLYLGECMGCMSPFFIVALNRILCLD